MASATETAEERFRAAFQRLKADKPEVMPPGTPVSQNHVAKEAGTDPTALRKARYPALIREIQAWVEINGADKAPQKGRRARLRRDRDDLRLNIRNLQAQRDHAQAQLVSAQRAVLELLQEQAIIQARLDDFLPPPTPLRK